MTNESNPQAKISAQEAEVARLRHDLELAEAVLRGMLAVVEPSNRPPAPIIGRVASIVPTPNRPLSGASMKASAGEFVSYRGRQPGAISRQWRDTLAMLRMNYPFPEGFTEYSAATAAQAAGLPNVRPKDALDRLTAYLSHGYVERLADGKWVVTDLAAKKYGFSDRGASTSEPVEAS